MKKRNIIRIIVAVLLILAVVVIHFRKPGKINGFESAVTTINGIEIPEGTRIIALGEATHGNKEFQQLKLEVFRELVEKTNVRAIILEGDVGGCAIANAYIQGNDDTAEAVTKRLGYRIYRTDQMCELVEWMHDYNETAEEEDKVRLYGMDMQYDEDSIEAIKRFYEKVDESKKEAYSAKMLEYLGASDYEFDASKYDEIIALMDEIQKDIDENKEAYAEITGEAETETIKWIATNIQYFISYHVKENATHMARDTYMKMNVDRILEVEEREHNGAVMIACHNSHMTKNLSTQFTFLGKFLRDEYADSYFAIGTDYYYSNDNVPNGNTSERITVKFCSDDPIGYQVKNMPENKYYIDFSHVDNSTPLGNIINKRIKTGSVGEQYNVLFKVMKMLSQVNYAPTDMYDAMIVFYEVNPITIWED